VGDLAGQLGEGDVECLGQRDRGRQNRLLLARFVARELTKADAGPLRQLGLRQPERNASGADDVRDVHLGMLPDGTDSSNRTTSTA
jgi:hypothetical protein